MSAQCRHIVRPSAGLLTFWAENWHNGYFCPGKRFRLFWFFCVLPFPSWEPVQDRRTARPVVWVAYWKRHKTRAAQWRHVWDLCTCTVFAFVELSCVLRAHSFTCVYIACTCMLRRITLRLDRRKNKQEAQLPLREQGVSIVLSLII